MDKQALYQSLNAQVAALISGERNLIANLSNVSALLNMTLEEINWVGFYLLENDDELVLGPFQGKPACVRIPVGKGVCGTAVAEDKTQLVADVHQFAGHIACDAASNSEIVVPVHQDNKVIGVLDIDSPIFSRFDSDDQAGLEQLVKILEENI
jgi:GAF domain-containing protein